MRSREANGTAAEFVRQRIRDTVNDPKVAELLCPDNVIGCKRPCLDTGYFETSWYLGKNIPGKPQVFMPLIGFPPYAEKCAQVAENGYQGFDLG